MTITVEITGTYTPPGTSLKITAFRQGDLEGLKWPSPLRPAAVLLGADSALRGELSAHGRSPRLTILPDSASHDFVPGDGFNELLEAMTGRERQVDLASLRLRDGFWVESVAWRGGRGPNHVTVLFSSLDRPAMLDLLRRTGGVGVKDAAIRALSELYPDE